MKECYIIGFPLKKPRSVLLWKKYFKKNKIHSSMQPLQITKKQIKKFIEEKKNDENFLASAVTMPLKNEIFKYIKPGDKIASSTKAVNFILKKKKTIYGYNTDISAIISLIDQKYLKNVLILGLGGVGYALFRYLKKIKNINVCALSRSKKSKNIFNKLEQINMSKINLVINCTPIGSNLNNNLKKKSPIKFDDLKKLNKKTFIFDIIYNPKLTKLLRYSKKLNLRFTNGIEMNSRQAEIALKMISANL